MRLSTPAAPTAATAATAASRYGLQSLNMPNSGKRWSVWTVIGWLAIAGFVVIYGAEFLPRHGPPVTIQWLRETLGTKGLIAVNILIVTGFLALLPYRRPTKGSWKSKGAFLAFVIALMTEMFGWPLLLFLLSPLVEIPSIARPWFDAVGHWPATVGTVMSLGGLALVAGGWQQIHRAEGLVSTGLYRLMRHPQYTGLFLFTLGWILHWPSIVTLALWPVLLLAYIWVARFEERLAVEEFGQAYNDYAARTARFIPSLV